MWAIAYVFDDQAWEWHLLPLPTSHLIPTKYQGKLRDVVQGPEKDMEMVSISLVCLKSSGCLRVTQIKRTCISGRGDILSV